MATPSLRYMGDTLASMVAGLGTGRDKAATVAYTGVIPDAQQLIAAYRTSAYARKAVDIPAEDATREWRAWQAQADQITAIEAEEARLGVQAAVKEVLTKARLLGRAAIYIGTAEPDPRAPLVPQAVKKDGLLYLAVIERQEIHGGHLVQDPASARFGRPEFYTLSIGGIQIEAHHSRIVNFIGQPLPSRMLAAANDEGDSILNTVLEKVRNADAAEANVSSLLFEAKVDVIRVPELMESLADPAYEIRLLKRFSLASVAKGINGTLILDKEEEYQSKSASFAQLPELMGRFVQAVAGAADIPVTRFLGQSASGLNATGDNDLRNYYDSIASMQRLKVGPQLALLDEAIIWSALGKRPPEVHYNWASLWQISDKERSEIGKTTAETIEKLNDSGLYPREALAKAGANALTESGVLPGFIDEITKAGGFTQLEAAGANDPV